MAYLCRSILPVFPSIPEEGAGQEVLHLLAEGCLFPLDQETAGECVGPVFTFLLVREGGEAVKGRKGEGGQEDRLGEGTESE